MHLYDLRAKSEHTMIEYAKRKVSLRNYNMERAQDIELTALSPSADLQPHMQIQPPRPSSILNLNPQSSIPMCLPRSLSLSDIITAIAIIDVVGYDLSTDSIRLLFVGPSQTPNDLAKDGLGEARRYGIPNLFAYEPANKLVVQRKCLQQGHLATGVRPGSRRVVVVFTATTGDSPS